MLYEEKGICQEDYIVGSFPRNYGCGPDNDTETEDVNSTQKHRIFLMGLRRSGKSSIYKVVFHKMSPSKTLYLESTSKIVKEKDEKYNQFVWLNPVVKELGLQFKSNDIFKHSFIQFQIWDFPGEIDIFDPTFDSETIFGSCGAIVFVIDAQDDYLEALNILHRTIFQAYKINCKIHFEVFIHKTDGLLYDHKIETQRDIHKRANEDLEDSGIKSVRLSFHLTSIYDHSIFEALSRVVQKLIPQVPALENLLDVLISNSVIEKAFLLDIASKIYIATDSSPLDMKSYELCCDMIDVVLDISYIYGDLWLIIVALIFLELGLSAKMVCSFSAAIQDSVKRGFPNDLSTYGMICGIFASMASLGAFAGPSVGGYLLETIGYRNSTAVLFTMEGVLIVMLLLVVLTSKTKQDGTSD